MDKDKLGIAYKNDTEYSDEFIDKMNAAYEEEYFGKMDELLNVDV